ncbi:signal peptidase I [Proteocatella sphenisci]|uniref:signal peptidase I n=1 Tax=Proteocatella sphenisci TaxID=181070 RepID=UPI0004ADD26A|nr:signal peptidase I [Proteocatella sphenisci]
MIKLSTRIRASSAIAVTMVAILYAAENTRINVNFSIGMITVPLWLIIAVIISRWFPQGRSRAKLQYKKKIYLWALNMGTAYVIINIIAGYLLGFGKSPYQFTLKGIALNIFLFSAVIGREFVRDYILRSFTEHKKAGVAGVTVLMTFIAISFFSWTEIVDFKSGVIFISETLLPHLGENILATTLVYFGGPWASVIYISITRGITFFVPILPNLNWLAKASIGFGIPVVCTVFFNNHYLRLTKIIKDCKNNDENVLFWVLTMVTSVALIWFVAGVFPLYPSAVATGSMIPVVQPGDVVIMRKITEVDQAAQLSVGDVIQFKRSDILITHRIVAIENSEKEEMRIITKGDNNSGIDSVPVGLEDLRGKLLRVIPKIGWPTLLLKSGNQILDTEVEF